jgi:hypothetical protein
MCNYIYNHDQQYGQPVQGEDHQPIEDSYPAIIEVPVINNLKH